MSTNIILSKIISESLLSLYPVFVKKINLSIDLQMVIRLITYVIISIFFINWSFVSKNILTYECVVLSIINLIHIYTSYEGFKNLDSGVSFAIFNIYPILILVLGGVLWKPAYLLGYLLAIGGLIMFIYGNYTDIKPNSITKSDNYIFGFVMIILAAITEAIIFFLIRNIPTDNSWNHIFLAYFFGAVIMTIYIGGMSIQIDKNTNSNSNSNSNSNTNSNSNSNSNSNTNINWKLIGIATLINGAIGLIGYYLRFYSLYYLDISTYSLLSYFGIIMAWIYGIIFNNETITSSKIIGTILIIIANFMISNF